MGDELGLRDGVVPNCGDDLVGEEDGAMSESESEYPRPWRVGDDWGHAIIRDADGAAVKVYPSAHPQMEPLCLAALVGAVNACDARLTTAECLALLAAGRVG